MITATKSNNRGGVPGIQKRDIHDRLIEWQALDKNERKESGIKTAKEFAKKYGVHVTSLSIWKKKKNYHELLRQAQILKLSEDTSDVLTGLKRRCIRYGMAYDVELWLLYVEGWDRKHILEILKEVKLGEDDIRSLVEYLPETKQKKFYDVLTDLIAEAEKARAIARN